MSLNILGYDVGGTKISTVVGNEKGEIISNVRMPTVKHLGKKRLIEELYTMGDSALKKAHVDKPDLIGVIFAGPVDAKNGVVISSPNIFGLNNFNIVEPLEKYYKTKTYLENDATAAGRRVRAHRDHGEWPKMRMRSQRLPGGPCWWQRNSKESY